MKSQPKRTVDVLVVGSGIVGGFLACRLAMLGISVALCEKTPLAPGLFKGEFFQPAAVQTIRDLGFGFLLEETSGEWIQEINFAEASGERRYSSRLEMKFLPGKEAFAVGHYEFRQHLLETCRSLLADRFYENTSVKPIPRSDGLPWRENPYLELSDGAKAWTMEPKWVIGCDGHSSSVRKWIGGPNASANGGVVWGAASEILFGVMIGNRSTSPSVYHVIRDARMGTFSWFSLGKAGQRLYLSRLAKEKSNIVEIKEMFSVLARKHGTLGAKEEIKFISPVKGSPALTEWLGPCWNGRVILAGDAMGITTCYGGQGMTIGLNHVRFLTEDPCWVSASPNSAQVVLSTYEKFAKGAFKRITSLNRSLYYFFFSQMRLMPYCTRYVVNHWTQRPDLRLRVLRLFAGLDQDPATLGELVIFSGTPAKQAPKAEKIS